MTDTALPNFLIVGAAKSGTTSLYHYLRQHPDVFMPDWKEPAFFSPPEAGGIQDFADYQNLFSSARGKKAIGEASVSYLYAPEAPAKIYETLGPDTKIIILLRNPINMAYSLWGHQVREGFEDLDFAEALAAERGRLDNPKFAAERYSWVADFAYQARADYMPQIARYDALFPKENIAIFIYEEFFRDGLPLMQALYNFLGLEAGFTPEAKRHNVAGTVRSEALRTILRKPGKWKEPLKKIMPLPLRSRLKEALEKLNRVATPLPPLDDKTRDELEQFFSPGVRALEKRLGRSLQDLWF